MTGLGPRGITHRGDFTFGRVPGTAIIYMGTARKGCRLATRALANILLFFNAN
jgi:hypothetical protein